MPSYRVFFLGWDKFDNQEKTKELLNLGAEGREEVSLGEREPHL
jgi:hypothetical protein